MSRIDVQVTKVVREVKLPYEFNDSISFPDGVELVYDEITGEKLCFIRLKEIGVLTEFSGENSMYFSEGLAAAKFHDKWGYINTNGDFEIEPQFLEADDFEDGIAYVQDANTEKYGYINKLGSLILDDYDDIEYQ